MPNVSRQQRKSWSTTFPNGWAESPSHHTIYDALVADGIPAEHLKQVHAPIGLDIGAVSPQEIAVSILAELIAVKHGKIRSREAADLSMRWNHLHD
jgi:xanthine/CO dehydrogenase XdhC/CoxF family maturation factor